MVVFSMMRKKSFKVAIMTLVIIIFLLLLICLLLNKKHSDHSTGRELGFISTGNIQGHFRQYCMDDAHDHGILIWLHGDGKFEYKHPNSKEYLAGKHGIISLANRKKMKLIVPETPAADDTWWQDGSKNADWLIELINGLSNRYHTKNIWIAGFSGGAEEISYYILPRLKQISASQGGAVLFGGGGSPRKEGLYDRVPQNKVYSKKFPLIWIVGEHDDGHDDAGFNALQTSNEGLNFYRQQGWQTKRLIIPDKAHLLRTNDVGMYGDLLGRYIDY